MTTVIERAVGRLASEERQHDLGADNAHDLAYWAAYLDGARAQKREDEAESTCRGGGNLKYYA